jgi:RNA polymerase sigma factor (sigma-70 family)
MRLIEQLLKEISQRKEDPIKADHSFRQLRALYGRLVRGACVRACNGFAGIRKEDIEDLEQEVWIKIFLVISYEPKPSANSKEEERRFFAWVARIAKNIKYQEFRRKQVQLNLCNDLPIEIKDDAVSSVAEQPETSSNAMLQEQVFNILHSLSELEAEVMRTTLEHLPNKVPTSEITRIVETFGTSSANIRKIRERVKARIKGLMILDKSAVSGKLLVGSQ